MTTAATISARLTLDSSEFNRGLTTAQAKLKAFGTKVKQFGQGMISTGKIMTTALTLPIVAGAGLAGKALIGLDTQMKNIQSISGITDAELKVLQDTFVDMSMDITQTTDSAEKLAEGFYFIQSSGFEGAAGMEVLRVSTKAATAGLTSTEVASNAVLAVLNAYGLEAGDAAHVSDVLFKTVDVGVLSFEELASQLGDVTNLASNVNMPIEEVGAAIAIMTRKGIQAPEAFTALNQLMVQAISPSDKMKDAAKALGVELSADNLRSQGLPNLLQQIQDADPVNGILSVFGDNVRALKGALALTGTEGEFAEMLSSFDDVEGRTGEAFATQTEAISAQLKNFWNIVTGLAMTLAEIFLPILMDIVTTIKPYIENFKNADDKTKKMALAGLAVVAALGPLLMIVGSLVSMIGSLITIVGAITTGFLIAVGWVLVIVAALGLLYYAWVNNIGGIQEKWQAFVDWFKPIWDNFWNGLLAVFDFFKQQFQTLQEAWQLAVEGNWYAFGAKLREGWDRAWTAISEAVAKAWPKIKAGASNMVKLLIEYIKNIDWASVGENIVRGIANGITTAIDWIINAVIEMGSAILEAIQGFLNIQSPSKVMKDLVGANMALGIIEGYQGTLNKAISSGAFNVDATSDINSSISRSAQRGSIAGGNDNGNKGMALSNYGTINIQTDGKDVREDILKQLQLA